MSFEPAPMTLEEYQLLNELICELYGLHFPSEKRELLEARLRPRLRDLQMSRFMDYYLLLRYEPAAEESQLTHLVTNNETYFFRETWQYEALFEDALDDLKAAAAEPGALRVLCAGCSSGEEPYTLNIYAAQHGFKLGGTRIEIDAFDLDRDRLETAGKAVYGPNSLRSTSEDQIRSFFTRCGADVYELQARYRSGVEFSVGNILDLQSYPSQEPYDVVFCRNVLIYFSEAALRRAIENFARSLRPGGVLFLGHSESIIGLTREFETIRLARCIAYRRA